MPEHEHTSDRSALRADCARCFALCCVALPFAASSGFALDKPAGKPCPHLRGDHRCGIHTGLRERGFTGCTVYDCFGAGQRVSQVTFGGRDWRGGEPAAARLMFDVFPVVRRLHDCSGTSPRHWISTPRGRSTPSCAEHGSGPRSWPGGRPRSLPRSISTPTGTRWLNSFCA